MTSTTLYIRWQNGDTWLGYFEQFPDYLTQGESLSQLEGVRSVAKLSIE